MRSKAVIGLKPELDNRRLLETARTVLAADAEVHLVSLVEVSPNDLEMRDIDAVKSRVEETAEQLRGDGYRVTTQVEPAALGLGAELARIAESVGADLLVIGLAKRSRVSKALLGSDAQTTLMHAPCPVLAVRID